MRYGLLILLGLFLFSIVSATEAETSFTVGGCSFPYEGSTISVPKGTCSVGEITGGMFYCAEEEGSWVTTSQGKGCSRGQNSIPSGVPLCCPPGYWCNETALATFQCQRSTELCSSKSEVNCEELSTTCVWLDELESPSCVASVADQSCAYYQSNETCFADELNLARVGVGSNIFGNFIECNNQAFSVLAENSSCEWDSVAQKCGIDYVAVKADGSDISFSCSNVYTLGLCEDGKQAVEWTSKNSSLGFPDGVPEECLRALNCVGGETERFCGEPPIKLSGFSLFALLASLSIIGISYFVKEKQTLNKREY